MFQFLTVLFGSIYYLRKMEISSGEATFQVLEWSLGHLAAANDVFDYAKMLPMKNSQFSLFLSPETQR